MPPHYSYVCSLHSSIGVHNAAGMDENEIHLVGTGANFDEILRIGGNFCLFCGPKNEKNLALLRVQFGLLLSGAAAFS